MKFSIIIPCYKVEKYISACLDSVLAQKCDSWEAICTDDGSPDGTGAILDEYAAKDSRIKVIHQQNAGLSAARNAAMAQATGEWLVYLDSDDVLSPWALEDASKSLEQCPDADMIRGGFRSFKDGEAPRWERDEKVGVVDTSKELPSSLFGGGGFQRYFVRRSKFGDIPFAGLNWNEERPYFAKCYARTDKVVTIDSDFYGYRLRAGSITATKMTLEQQKGNLDATRICMRIYRDCGKQIPASVMRGFMMSWMEYQPQFIEQFLRKDERPAAWRYWFGSLGEAAQFAVTMSLWRRFTIAVCRLLPFRVVPMVLCYFPHWLKLKGLHR